MTFCLQESALSIPYYFDHSEVSLSRSATLPRRHRRLPSNDSSYITCYADSREQSPTIKYNHSQRASNTLPRNPVNRRSPLPKSNDISRKTSRSSLNHKPCSSANDVSKIQSQDEIRQKQANIATEDVPKPSSSQESLKTSQRNNSEVEDYVRDSQNSGPSSIESHKSSKTGSSLTTSGPSSLESHKTVIKRGSNEYTSPVEGRVKKPTKRKELSVKSSMNVNNTNVPPSNSFTLQVTTSQNTNNATINGSSGSGNTKIFVQNSPIRSVITFENGRSSEPNANFVIINGSDPVTNQPGYSASNNEIKVPMKNTNIKSKDENVSLNNSKDILTNTDLKTENQHSEPMNNNRKLSLQLPQKDGLNYCNLIKNMPSSSHNQFSSNSNPDSPINNGFREFTKNAFSSNSPSPTKSFEGISASTGNVYCNNISDTKLVMASSKVVEKNVLGSEPNISHKASYLEKPVSRENSEHQFPSLSDLSFNFSSLAAQKILKGVSINSIDTLVELNMAANGEKQNNFDVVHTDFGLV